MTRAHVRTAHVGITFAFWVATILSIFKPDKFLVIICLKATLIAKNCPGVAATFGDDGFAGEEVVVSNSLTLVLGEEVVVVGPKTTNVS